MFMVFRAQAYGIHNVAMKVTDIGVGTVVVKSDPAGPMIPRGDREMLEAGRNTPVGRMVTVEDIAKTVAFLCSPDAEMIRGQIIVVDGGVTLKSSE